MWRWGLFRFQKKGVAMDSFNHDSPPSRTVPSALAAIVTSVNRVNGVYEKEVAVRMVLVANNDTLVFTKAGTDAK